jgi:alpha-beta hydrolase superfamily lysophospholipase
VTLAQPIWAPDVLGPGFEAATLELAPDDEGPVVATVTRAPAPAAPHGGAVLYVHGYNDYFFQADLARFFASRGWAFHALDLRKYGRSLRPHQTPNFCRSLTDYDEELDITAALLQSQGHTRLLLVAHSTGGLVLPLWLARRSALQPLVAGLVLNSAFLDFKQPPALGAMILPLIRRVARWKPTGALPVGSSRLYGESLHASRRGDWSYDLDWKPVESFPVRYGWLAAVAEGHRQLRAGLRLRFPVLALSSTRTVRARSWTPALREGDAVLDADRIAVRAALLGPDVTVARIPDGLHDLVLSGTAARACTYATLANWLDARLS